MGARRSPRPAHGPGTALWHHIRALPLDPCKEIPASRGQNKRLLLDKRGWRTTPSLSPSSSDPRGCPKNPLAILLTMRWNSHLVESYSGGGLPSRHWLTGPPARAVPPLDAPSLDSPSERDRKITREWSGGKYPPTGRNRWESRNIQQ